jgi:hypothetical protein
MFSCFASFYWLCYGCIFAEGRVFFAPPFDRFTAPKGFAFCSDVCFAGMIPLNVLARRRCYVGILTHMIYQSRRDCLLSSQASKHLS